MKIERAVDWNEVSIELKAQLTSIHNPDLLKMLKNIDLMVNELSKLEVGFRRSGKYDMLNEKVNAVNQAINHLEKLILIARLMK
jgi:hypothetical protein